MSNGQDLTAAKLELVRELTVAYMTNLYPKPLTALSDDVRKRTVQQHLTEISEFMKTIYNTVDELIAE